MLNWCAHEALKAVTGRTIPLRHRDRRIRLGQAPALKPEPGPRALPRCPSREAPWRGTGTACAPALRGAWRVPQGCPRVTRGDSHGSRTDAPRCVAALAAGGLTPTAPAREAELTVGRQQGRRSGSPRAGHPRRGGGGGPSPAGAAPAPPGGGRRAGRGGSSSPGRG